MDGSTARAVLGVHAHADQDQISRAFRRAALVAHPDRGGDPARFRQLVAARAAALTGTTSGSETPHHSTPGPETPYRASSVRTFRSGAPSVRTSQWHNEGTRPPRVDVRDCIRRPAAPDFDDMMARLVGVS